MFLKVHRDQKSLEIHKMYLKKQAANASNTKCPQIIKKYQKITGICLKIRRANGPRACEIMSKLFVVDCFTPLPPNDPSGPRSAPSPVLEDGYSSWGRPFSPLFRSPFFNQKIDTVSH